MKDDTTENQEQQQNLWTEFLLEGHICSHKMLNIAIDHIEAVLKTLPQETLLREVERPVFAYKNHCVVDVLYEVHNILTALVETAVIREATSPSNRNH